MHIEAAGAACNISDRPADVIKDRLMTDIPEQGKPFWTRLKSNVSLQINVCASRLSVERQEGRSL